MAQDNDGLEVIGTLFSTRNLIAALLFVAGTTLAILTWEAERALSKLDSVDASASQTANQVGSLISRVDDMKDTQRQYGVTLIDHEKRITTLEANDGSKHTR